MKKEGISIRMVLTEKAPFKVFCIYEENIFFIARKCVNIEELIEANKLTIEYFMRFGNYGLAQELEEALERNKIKEFISEYYIITEGTAKGVFL